MRHPPLGSRHSTIVAVADAAPPTDDAIKHTKNAIRRRIADGMRREVARSARCHLRFVRGMLTGTLPIRLPGNAGHAATEVDGGTRGLRALVENTPASAIDGNWYA